MSVKPILRSNLSGAALISSLLKHLPAGPGVYRMIDASGVPLYIGKAKSLRKRVNSYTRPQGLSKRIRVMVEHTADLEVVSTNTEAEALLLESNLIKKLRPRYNILLRDDKSFPFILLRTESDWAQLIKHRGARKRDGDYFGPFASASAVNRTINTLQKVFPLRSCTDSIFSGRNRPCLQYQINRCTAPCVGLISRQEYSEIVDQARAFLTGHSRDVQHTLSKKMEDASEVRDYETAAIYRDRIRALTQIQAHQEINVGSIADADIIAASQNGGLTCIQIFFFRSGQNYGTRTYFPNHAKTISVDRVLEAFIGQFYSGKEPPKLVLISHELPNQILVQEALGIRAGRKVEISLPRRGSRRAVINNAIRNANDALARRLSESASQLKLLEGVADLLDLEEPPKRIEVYDNSHISGTNPLGVMIVSGYDGFEKKAYRRFNIKNHEAEPGDDYAMTREVLTRRLSRALKEDPNREGSIWPDLILLDGGRGQLSIAMDVLDELGIPDQPIAAIAKGPDRNAGRERFYVPGREPFTLPVQDPVLYFMQRLRDEAHRFAVGGHRARRGKNTFRSVIDEIPGIGIKRKRALLNHFGSAASIAHAGLSDLEAVNGISRTVAQRVYDHFRVDG
ncbi:MAG: UvrABC system protein C [Alphaproteobacteria bacterium MarineAlpha11_Bin1]|nr:MAG: UvrABC system protein C [Alphaproteobacteria bacterium MarineAlpha11_Bin1]|tara:strand:- start:4664 stop:6535 length:1872 start_codon:yes stop_codon:yes gene_type:complete